MFRIVICDDEMGIRNTLHVFLDRYAAEHEETFDIQEFQSANDLLKEYPENADLILLDIKMQGIDGMAAAREIRARDTQVCIIFITTMYQYAIEGYAVRAFGFIRKPVHYSEFSHELGYALLQIQGTRAKETLINVRDGATVYRLVVSGIICLEVRNHSVLITMEGEQLEVRGQINQFEEMLSAYGFFRPHAAYLVNGEYIRCIDNSKVILKNGTEVPLSQHRKKQFLAAISEYLGARI